MWVIIRLQGLPLSANTKDIRNFFQGLDIRPGGVRIFGGEKNNAFIAFSTDEDARKAMLLTNNLLNGVPVQLFLSSRMEMKYELKQLKDRIEAISSINTSMSAVTVTHKVVSQSTTRPPVNIDEQTALGSTAFDKDPIVQTDQGNSNLSSFTTEISTAFNLLSKMIHKISQDVNVQNSHSERISNSEQPVCEHSAIGSATKNTKLVANSFQENMDEVPFQPLDIVQKRTIGQYIATDTTVIHQRQSDQNFRMPRQRPYDLQKYTPRQRLNLHC